MPHDPYELTEEQIRSWSKDEILQFFSRKLKELAKLNEESDVELADLKKELAELKGLSNQSEKLTRQSEQELADLKSELKRLKAENDQLGVKYDELIARLKGYLAQEQKQKPR